MQETERKLIRKEIEVQRFIEEKFDYPEQIKCGEFTVNNLRVHRECDKCGCRIQEKITDLQLPNDPEEFTKAKERMKAYSEEKDKVTEIYYELYDFIDGKDVCQRETLSLSEAKEWVKEGIMIDSGIEGCPPYPARWYYVRFRRVTPKT